MMTKAAALTPKELCDQCRLRYGPNRCDFYRNHCKVKERVQPQVSSVEPRPAPTEYYRQDYQPVPLLGLGKGYSYELSAQPQDMSGVETAKR